MKQYFSPSIGVGLAIILARKVNSTDIYGSNLFDRWALQFPLINLVDENNTITMDYQISESLSSDNIRAEIFTKDCEYPLLTDGILSQTFNAQGAHVFQIDVKPLVQNPEVFDNKSDNPWQADMKFCLRYMLWSGPETDISSTMINYVEVLLTVYFDLNAGIYVGISVDKKGKAEPGGDKNNITEIEGYEADGFLCDPFTYERMETPESGFLPGDIICICAFLGEKAKEEGLYLKGLEEFKWNRDRISGGEVVRTTQYSVQDGISANALTEYSCPTITMCKFTTYLFADFYSLPGIVSGSGYVLFAFRTDDDEVGRRTSERTYRRSLQQDVGSNLQVSIPVSNRRPPTEISETAGGTDISYGRSILFFLVGSATAVLLCL